MDKQQNPENAFVRQLQLLRSAEQMLTNTMTGMIRKATNFGLKKSLEFHLAETHQHKTASDAICKQLEVDAIGETNEVLRALIEEGEQQVGTKNAGDAFHAAIIKAAVKIEQYDIEEYEKAAELAMQYGHDFVAARLSLTQQEEKQAQTKLKFEKKGFRINSFSLHLCKLETCGRPIRPGPPDPI